MIDKRKIKRSDYKVLENALTYNIQRIENDSAGKLNYIIITDKGRISPMRKNARSIRAYNPIHSKFSLQIKNQPIHSLIEDILEKDSNESHFIQVCDFVSYFTHLYQKCYVEKKKAAAEQKRDRAAKYRSDISGRVYVDLSGCSGGNCFRRKFSYMESIKWDL